MSNARTQLIRYFVTVTPTQARVIEIEQKKEVYLDEGGERRVVAAARELHPVCALVLPLVI